MGSTVKAVSNTVFLTLDWGFTTLLSFAYSFVIWKMLNPWDYGIITTAVNLMMMLGSISMFGMNTAIQKLVAEYVVKRQKEKIGSIIRMSLVIIFVFDLLICALLFFNRSFIASALKITDNVVLLICIGTVVFSLFYITSNILCGLQDMKGYFKTGLVGNISKFLISTTLIFLGFSYFGPLIGVIIGFAIVPFLRFKPFWFATSKNFDRKKVILEYSLPAFLAILASVVFNNAQYIILTTIKNPEVTGLFSLAMTISALIALIPSIINQAIFPIMSQFSVGKSLRLKGTKLIGTALRYSLLFTIPFSLMIVILMRSLILFLKIKIEYLSAVQYLPILSLSSLLIGCAGILTSNIYAIGKPKLNRNITILTAIVFLITSIPMTYLFSAYGLAFSFLIAGVLQFTVSYFYINRFIGFKLPLNAIGKILISSIIFTLLLYFGEKYFTSFILKAVVATISLVAYMVVLLFLKFFNGQDIFIVRHLTENFPKRIKDVAESFCKIVEKFI